MGREAAVVEPIAGGRSESDRFGGDRRPFRSLAASASAAAVGYNGSSAAAPTAAARAVAAAGRILMEHTLPASADEAFVELQVLRRYCIPVEADDAAVRTSFDSVVVMLALA